MRRVRLLVGIWALVVMVASGQCHNRCSGHGSCDVYGRCSCDDNWQGADCSLRSCPLGTAWVDLASSPNSAHAYAECSNRGICDRSTGVCRCESGYTGRACTRMECANDCNGHGRCLSMQEAANGFDAFVLNHRCVPLLKCVTFFPAPHTHLHRACLVESMHVNSHPASVAARMYAWTASHDIPRATTGMQQ